MVCLGTIAAMTSTSTLGKIVASAIPILIFFAQGFEHSVVNMFVIPTGMSVQRSAFSGVVDFVFVHH
jgi:formate transporter